MVDLVHDNKQGRVEGPSDVERPADIGGLGEPVFGSDVIARAIRALDIPYIALNPGASYRGLHDSLVNYLGNEQPQMLLCLHEEAAVAIAHGWAKVTGRPMLAAVHSNVGLMHATMAVFNAWCDRVPMILLGATGPVDAARRRPYIDWLHTAADQGSLVRHYTKWDDQPGSPAAAQESIMRGAWMAGTAPMAPVYINLDTEVQEQLAENVPEPLDPARFMPAVVPGNDDAQVEVIAEVLNKAERPVILMGRMSRSEDDWANRVALAEKLGAKVVTHKALAAAFPTRHALHAVPPVFFPDSAFKELLGDADVVLSLYWPDLGGALMNGGVRGLEDKTVIHVSLDHTLHNGWSMDHQRHPIVDRFLAADPDALVARLLPRIVDRGHPLPEVGPRAGEEAKAAPGKLTMSTLAAELRSATSVRDVTILHLPASWNSADWHYDHPLDFIGQDGGAGIGSGPGIAVGASLAVIGSGRLPIALVGDGDFLMGVTALWTACHYRIPMLMIVANNQSFYNDEVHQQKVAQARGRPVENKWIGQRIADPDIDIAGMASAQGALGLGPARTVGELQEMLKEAMTHVDEGGVAVIDVRVIPGYTKSARDAMAGNAVGRD